MATWGERQPDGSVNVISDDSGTPVVIRNEPWNVNQGISTPAAPSAAQTNPYTMPVVGGTAQLPPWLAGADAAYQERYFNDYLLPQLRWNQGMDVADLSGYMPGANFAAMQGTAPGGAAGTYQTVKGPRTIQQMREELKAANYPEWETADENTIVSKFAGVAKGLDGQIGAVTPQATSGGGATGGGGSNLASSNKAMVDWYHEFTARNNGRAPSKEEWAGQLSFLTGMDRDKAVQAYDYWRDWQARTGKSNPNDEEWARGLEQVQPGVGRERTLPGQKWDYYTDTEFPWKQTMDAANLIASKSGPQDWPSYWQAMQTMGQPDRNNTWEARFGETLNSIFGRQPGGPNETAPAQAPGGGAQPQEGAAQVPGQGSTQTVQNRLSPEQSKQLQEQYAMQPYAQQPGQAMQQDIMRYQSGNPQQQMQPQQGAAQQPGQAGLKNQWEAMQQAPQTQGVDATAKQLGFESRPNQISAQKYYNWSPTMRQGQGGYAKDLGYDQTDFWDQMQKSLPKGQASSRTVWR